MEETFESFMMQQAYAKVSGLGDRLKLIKEQINWTAFRPIISSVFHDDKITGGRPHTDEEVIIRCFILQELYNLSDQELEFAVNDRLSFRNFVGFTDKVPDFTTIWRIRERLNQTGKYAELWNLFQRMLTEKGFEAKKGVLQDASFIDADYGRVRKANEKKLKKEGKLPEYSEKQLQHMDKDGTFTVKNNQVHYGYKLHVKTDRKFNLIRDFDVSTASLHDSQIDLSRKGESVYRDKGYFGSPVHNGVKNRTMNRATRGHPLSKKDEERNRKISRIRCAVELVFAVKRRVFGGQTTRVTQLTRVRVKEMFACMAFDLYRLVSLVRRRLSAS